MDQNLNIPQISPVAEATEATNPQPGTTKSAVAPAVRTAPTVPPPQKKVNIYLIISGILLILVLATVIPGYFVYQSALGLYSQAQKLEQVVKSQNIPQIKPQIAATRNKVQSVKSAMVGISWMKVIPFVGSYVSDASHVLNAADLSLQAADITLTAVEPYMSILGFGGANKAEDGLKTTQERIDFVVKAIPDLTKNLDDLSSKLKVAGDELDKIDPNRYPVAFNGHKIREPLKTGLDLFNEVASKIEESKPLLQSMPYLLGVDNPRTYLVLFQNDKELRPTGGFLTAYSIMKVDKAKFNPVSSNDIYNLDAQYQPRLPAPAPLVKYIKGPYILSQNIRLRDMNWSPDFKTTMDLFLPEAKSVGVTGIDGVIAVDTQLLVNLLDAIGPIGVPGFGNFSTQIEPKCNCPQVIYELESFADVEGPIIWDPVTGKIILRPPNSDNRKKIIGPLMNSIMANALGQPKDKLPKLFTAVFKSIMEKHVLFYMNDPAAQSAVEAFNLAGRIKEVSGEDYLHINDANLGGRKSNLYVTQEVDQEVTSDSGGVTDTLTITYKNSAKQDGWLNSILPDWIRVYVPKGSILIAAEGLDDKAAPYEEFNKTVFAGFYQLRPEGESKITFKYKVPYKVSGNYKILVQKQPGTDDPMYTITYGGKEQDFTLNMDKEIKL
ncbi:MAG: DUF4012 domain-containing protein [Candidatus Microgenomates bacterium]|jgi:hypothetical protein